MDVDRFEEIKEEQPHLPVPLHAGPSIPEQRANHYDHRQGAYEFFNRGSLPEPANQAPVYRPNTPRYQHPSHPSYTSQIANNTFVSPSAHPPQYADHRGYHDHRYQNQRYSQPVHSP